MISRPCEAAPVTTLPSITQLTAQFVWPVTTTSISSSIAATIGGRAPVGLTQLLTASCPGAAPAPFPAVETLPPSWSRTMIVSTFCFFSSATAAFAVSASWRKSTVLMPAGVTIVGVVTVVMPMIPTLMPLKWWMAYGAKIGSPLSLYVTFAARKSNVAPPYGSPSPQPSTGWQPSPPS